jgi:hypothetical protein
MFDSPQHWVQPAYLSERNLNYSKRARPVQHRLWVRCRQHYVSVSSFSRFIWREKDVLKRYPLHW